MTTATSASPPGWYVHRDEYWVLDEPGQYPVRQGDLFHDVSVRGHDKPWDAAIVIHPTCELAKKSVGALQVARVLRLADLQEETSRPKVQAGAQVRSGITSIAFAHTFFVAPVIASPLTEPMFADFRQIGSVSRQQLDLGRRVGAMTHDARVTFIRRYTYFRFRQLFTFEQIREFEAARIKNDPAFAGPRPAWA